MIALPKDICKLINYYTYPKLSELSKEDLNIVLKSLEITKNNDIDSIIDLPWWDFSNIYDYV